MALLAIFGGRRFIKMSRWRRYLTKSILAVTALIYLFSVLLMNNLPVTDLHNAMLANTCCSNSSSNVNATPGNTTFEGRSVQMGTAATKVPSLQALTTLSSADELGITYVTATMPWADKLTHKTNLTNSATFSAQNSGQPQDMITNNSKLEPTKDLQGFNRVEMQTQQQYKPQNQQLQEQQQEQQQNHQQKHQQQQGTAFGKPEHFQSESRLLSKADDTKVVFQNTVHPGGAKKDDWSSDLDREGGWARQLINQEGLCAPSEDTPSGPYLLILVQSNFAQSAQRNAIRDTWGRVRNDFTSPRHVVIVFLLGAPNDTDYKSWDSIHKENRMYRDILLWNIGDGHHNHTAKSILGLLWSFEYCPQAKYVLKTVDDIYLNVTGIVEYLSYLWASKYTVTGHVEISGQVPHCSGAAYAVGMDFVRGINRFLYSWLSTYANATLPEEDVYVTATLASTLGRQCRHEQRFPAHETIMNAGKLCKLLDGDLFGVHGVSFQMMYLIWKANQEFWECDQRPEALQDWLSQQYQYLNLYEEVEDGFTGG